MSTCKLNRWVTRECINSSLNLLFKGLSKFIILYQLDWYRYLVVVGVSLHSTMRDRITPIQVPDFVSFHVKSWPILIAVVPVGRTIDNLRVSGGTFKSFHIKIVSQTTHNTSSIVRDYYIMGKLLLKLVIRAFKIDTIILRWTFLYKWNLSKIVLRYQYSSNCKFL